MTEHMTFEQKLLFENRDAGYRDFHSRLVPNVPKQSIIGVRLPKLRQLAKRLLSDASWRADRMGGFLSELPHKYYDENMLHALIVSAEKDFDKCVELVEAFLPYVDNWAVCDCFSPVSFKKNSQLLWQYIERWLSDSKTYTNRFGIDMAIKYYLDDAYSEDVLSRVCSVKNDDYYVKMAVAWFLSVALVKHYHSALAFMQAHPIDVWTYNKALQKAVESFRLTDAQKSELKSLKKRQ